jgi:LysM repeat protein
MEVHNIDERGQAQSYDPYTLIAEVNALRSANGLPELIPDPILMSVSQGHADYMASTGTVTHYSADGSRPFQRSLVAGYPVAGDLSLGGFHSENIIAGTNMTPAEAVSRWTGDEPHLNTMISPQYVDIGAGVSIVGNKIYYVIDTSRKSGSAVPAYTPQVVNGTAVVNLNPLVSTIFPSTPASDGSVIHQVRPGETLWLIAITYGVKIDDVLKLNNIPKDSPIYPGQQLVIKMSLVTPSPETLITGTAPPDIEAVPTSTRSEQTEQPTNTLVAASGNKSPVQRAGFMTPVIIVIGALVIAGLIAFSSGRRKRI